MLENRGVASLVSGAAKEYDFVFFITRSGSEGMRYNGDDGIFK